MMSTMVIIVCLLSLLVTKEVFATENITIEGEDAKHVINSRSEASNKATLLLNEKDKATFDFCLNKAALVKVKNIRYSNDGDADNVNVIVNDKTMGSFQSTGSSNNGVNWNQFQLSGEIGEIQLDAGKHKLFLEVPSADKYGIEIDNIQFDVGNDDDQGTFRCDVQTILIEGEDADGQFQINTRSAASNSKTLKLSNKDEAIFKFCVSVVTRFTLANILSSNDGNADTMEVKLDDNVLGTFKSIAGSNGGQNWNVFSSSGQIGTEKILGIGDHTVKITVNDADTYGVEIDVLQLKMLGTGISKNDDIKECGN